MGLPILFARKKKFSPRQLFAAGEQGVWYDPSDWTTLFQDSAGTTPVTAIEQPVGLILDKSGRGNHASQPTTTSRPILRNRYNLLTYTEQFDNAAWEKTSGFVTVSANQTTAPDGTSTADLIAETTANNYHSIFTSVASRVSVTSGVAYTMSVYVKKGPGATAPDIIQLTHNGIYFPTSQYANFNISNGTVTAEFGSTSGYPATITSVGDGWYRITFTATCTSSNTAGGLGQYVFVNNNPTAGRLPTYVGATTSNVYLWGASLVVANEAHLPYQWVTTGATSYTNDPSTGSPSLNIVTAGYDTDVTKFPPYLFFDGSDDWLQTANIDFSATDKVSVFAGVRKLSDAAAAEIINSASSGSNVFRAFCSTNIGAVGRQNWAIANKVNYGGTTTAYPSPDTRVATWLFDNSAVTAATQLVLRLNGVSRAIGFLNTSTVTGNFLNLPIYIGRFDGASTPLNGRIYSIIIRGALTSSPQLEQTEKWVAAKTRVTL